MSFNEQDFVQGIANLRYRKQREPLSMILDAEQNL